MKSDQHGVSTCPIGAERYEDYYSSILNKFFIQYEYRAASGELFSCAVPNLRVARSRRDIWLADLILNQCRDALTNVPNAYLGQARRAIVDADRSYDPRNPQQYLEAAEQARQTVAALVTHPADCQCNRCTYGYQSGSEY